MKVGTIVAALLRSAKCLNPHWRTALHRSAATTLALALYAPACFAATLVTSSLDSGGGRSSAGNYVNDGCIGGIAGISTVASPPETVEAGYLGQLTEVISVSVTGVPAQVSETSTSQLSGVALLDDASVTVLPGSEISWSTPAWPVQDITASGVVSAAVVYANIPGTINGRYLDVLGTGSLLVLDTLPDNYGSYAGDGLPDWWQNQYFNLNNPNAAPGKDVTGTGQNNLFKYTAGLDPTNPASIFVLKIVAVTGQPTQKALTWKPWASGRTYTPLYRTNLVSGASWGPLPSYTGPTTNSTEITITDTAASEKTKFYRINISMP
jgi:hypothetical protein